jgi:hypothetical protein
MRFWSPSLWAPFFGVPFPAATVQDMMDEARKFYQGPLEAGVDLMTFEIGNEVTIKRPV